MIARAQTDLRDEYDVWLAEVDRKEVEQKRRLAPGYLDSGNRMLQPSVISSRHSTGNGSSSSSSAAAAGDNGGGMVKAVSGVSTSSPARDGKLSQEDNDIDKVFGKVSIS